METLLRIGLSNAVAALLLALLVVAVACVWRRPAVLHALWLLVLVKLVTPPLVWLPEPWAEPPAAPKTVDPPPAAAPEIAAVEAAPTARPVPDPNPDPVPDGDQSGTGTATYVVVASSPPAAPPPAAPAPTAPWWAAAAVGLWLAGALAWYILAVVRLRRFRRLLRHAVPAPESLRQRAQRLAEKMRLRRRPGVWLVPGRVAPMLWAAGGPPRILFPAELLDKTTPEQQNALLVHELAHLRRRDHWVRWLELAASGLYWWNPVLWLARRELREAEEQCCDAWVTSTLPGAGKTYAVALLETLDFLSDCPPATPLLASGVGRVADLKRRLTMIMRGTTPRALGWRGALAVLGLGALLLPLLPAWARAQPAPEPRPGAPAKADGPVWQFRIVGDGPAAGQDADKIKAELKELEAQLAQEEAKAAEISARIAALREKLARADGEGPRIVIAADAKGLNPADFQKWLQAAQLGGPAVKVIVIDRASGKIIMEKEPEAPAPAPAINERNFDLRPGGKPGEYDIVSPAPPAGAPVMPPAGVRVTPPPMPMGGAFIIVPAPGQKPAPGDADKRIDDLEKKLKTIQDELEQLRRDRKPGAPEGGASPIQKDPYAVPLVTNDGATAVEALRLKVLRLKDTAAAEAAKGQAAAGAGQGGSGRGGGGPEAVAGGAGGGGGPQGDARRVGPGQGRPRRPPRGRRRRPGHPEQGGRGPAGRGRGHRGEAPRRRGRPADGRGPSETAGGRTPQGQGGAERRGGEEAITLSTNETGPPRVRGGPAVCAGRYFFSPPFLAAGFASAAAGAAAAAPSAAAPSSSFAFLTFFTTIFTTRTFGRLYGLRPSGQRSSSCNTLIRSPRVSTLRARTSEFLRRRLLSIDMALPSLSQDPNLEPSS